MQRPSWKRVFAGTFQAWLVLACFWYAAIYAGMEAHDRTEPWQRVNPAPLLTLLAGMVLTVRLLPPRKPGFADRFRRSLVAAVPWTLAVAALALWQGRYPHPPDFVEGIYLWTGTVFLWAHGFPCLFLPAFYLVERPQVLGRVPGKVEADA